MNEIIGLLLVLFAGIILGVLFFGGLWLTVRKGVGSKKPTLIFLSSLIIRLGIVLLGFYYIGGNSWQKMLVCLVGFLIARIVVTHITKKHIKQEPQFIKPVSDEN